MGGCQNYGPYGPFLDPYYNTAPNISGTQKGAIILTTTRIGVVEGFYSFLPFQKVSFWVGWYGF